MTIDDNTPTVNTPGHLVLIRNSTQWTFGSINTGRSQGSNYICEMAAAKKPSSRPAKKKTVAKRSSSATKSVGAKKSMKSPSAPTKPKRRSPVSRAEGELRLIKAAIDLTKRNPFSEVGVREIAREADINHGFVHTWFGGKTELFLAVRQFLLRSIASRVERVEGNPLTPSTFLDEDVVYLVKLNSWLALEGESDRLTTPDRPLISSLAKNLENAFGLSPEDALIAAQLSSALTFGGLVFGPAMGMTTNMDELAAFWRHMLGLLAKNPPA